MRVRNFPAGRARIEYMAIVAVAPELNVSEAKAAKEKMKPVSTAKGILK